MTQPVRIDYIAPEPIDPERQAILASAISANIVLMNQMAESEVWVSSDEED